MCSPRPPRPQTARPKPPTNSPPHPPRVSREMFACRADPISLFNLRSNIIRINRTLSFDSRDYTPFRFPRYRIYRGRSFTCSSAQASKLKHQTTYFRLDRLLVPCRRFAHFDGHMPSLPINQGYSDQLMISPLLFANFSRHFLTSSGVCLAQSLSSPTIFSGPRLR